MQVGRSFGIPRTNNDPRFAFPICHLSGGSSGIYYLLCAPPIILFTSPAFRIPYSVFCVPCSAIRLPYLLCASPAERSVSRVPYLAIRDPRSAFENTVSGLVQAKRKLLSYHPGVLKLQSITNFPRTAY
jgi:hypothetical protein